MKIIKEPALVVPKVVVLRNLEMKLGIKCENNMVEAFKAEFIF